MEKRLTRRQQQFLLQFLDLYREMNQPLHYKFVAERLKIGKVSVYEMLRLLEFNGFVKAEFESVTRRPGPGRPSVLFYPTKIAFEQTQRLSIAPSDLEIWRKRKDYLLEHLANTDKSNLDSLFKELYDRYSKVEMSTLLQITENITMLLLTINRMPKTPELHNLLVEISQIGRPGRMNLSTLFGFALAIAQFGIIDKQLSAEFFNNINKYEFYLQDMHADNHQRLCDYTHDAVEILLNN
ncbi:hypothetical protein [Leptolinea tardivitalis]|uniref:Uncharacterized protein n=1 Tax=Leptolinea tardivitalis TaxID=229920 RepID=A0A0P6XH65_9CHLR|nr:hypothetical protein [Leptolinea tardivitalis]KPL70447.1 hypothetical protein ADM99_15015 [Leptolinea tardivitalis]GAP22032.1 hypothetical protein LTAR_02250 [Leptolinea tardivitalis]